MATLITSSNRKGINGRNQRKHMQVDLTAMVDLAFLLITFFMLTTALSKPRQMEVYKPVDGPEAPWPESRTMTILLAKNNQAVYYLGNPTQAQLRVVSISNIKRQILAAKKYVENSHADVRGKRMLVIIKPTDASVYKNLVDLLDEMTIAGITSYAISDQPLLLQEQNFISKKSN